MNTIRGALLWRGIVAFIVGVIAIAWPGVTIRAFVILFAVYAFIAAGAALTGTMRFGQPGRRVGVGAGGRAGGIFLAVIDVVAGIAALSWPGMTALALVWVVAAWAFIGGIAEIAMAFAAGESAGQRALLGLGGLVAIALGLAFAIRPDIGAATIAQVYGLFSMVAGVSALVMAANVGGRSVVPRVAT